MCCTTENFFKRVVLSFDRSDAVGPGFELFGFFLTISRSIQHRYKFEGRFPKPSTVPEVR